MSKRVRFSEETDINGDGASSSKKIRNEDEVGDDEYDFEKNMDDNEEVLDIRQIKAQEIGEVDEEDGVRFTAFNLEEEMEEGHFDQAGNFIFKKDTEIKDSWLDNIDWVEVKKTQVINEEDERDSDDDSSGDLEKVDRLGLYKKMVKMLNPGESVQQAIRRYGGSLKKGPKASKKNRSNSADPKEGSDSVDKEKMMEIIGYADEIVNDGEMDVYQFTHEKLSYLIKLAEKDNYTKIISAEKDGGDDDMFSESFDADKPSGPSDNAKKENGGDNGADEVMWEFRWQNNENEEIQGPYPTSQMIKWEKDAYFEDVFVRKVGSERFYPSNRIDFELYT